MGSFSRPKAAAETASAVQLRQRQAVDLARVDEQESERIKRIKRGRIGVFTGERSTLGGGLIRSTGGSSGGTANTGGRTGTPSMGSGSTT